jgi:plastocyanin
MRLFMTDRGLRACCAAALVAATAGCSESTPSTASTTTASPAPPPAATAAQLGRVDGKAAPNAIVLLEPKTPREFPPGEKPVMDQVSLTFIPGMLFVRTGQPVEFRNNDDTLHNVHVGNVDTKEPSFNVAIPTGEVYNYTFTKDGFYHVACDIHPAMSAEILATSSPYATAADADGAFGFVDVPPGPYVLRVFAGTSRIVQDVEIKPGANSVLHAEEL